MSFRKTSVLAVMAMILLTAAGCQSHRETDQAAWNLLEGSRQYFRQGYYARALALADSAGQLDHALPDVPYVRGLILTRLKKVEDARKAFQQALDLDPHYAGARFQLGNLYFREERFREAIGMFRAALAEFDPVESPFPRTDAYVNLGMAYSKAGIGDSARWAYREGIHLDSTYTPAYVLLGQEYRKDGDYKTALSYTRQALQLDPDNVTYQSIVGSILFQMGDMQQAVPYLQKVVAKRPWEHRAHLQLGRALIYLGKEARGQRHLVRADTLQAMQSRISRTQYQAMHHPDSLLLWVELGRSFYNIGYLKQARDVLEVALSLEPDNPALQANLASVIAQMGDTADAIQRYRMILKQDSSLGEVRANLEYLLARTRGNGSPVPTPAAGEPPAETNQVVEAQLDSLM